MKIGDKVVCVDDSPCPCGCGTPAPFIKNVVYVVSEYGQGILHFYINLIGITPNHSGAATVLGYRANRFRLLDELKAENRQLQQETTQTHALRKI